MKKCMSLVMIIFLVTLVSEPVQMDTAKNIAMNWYKGYSPAKTFPTISSVDEIKTNDIIDIFVFNMENGFVLVAGDDASVPVLGYSFDQKFDYSAEKANTKYWIDGYRKSLKEIRDNKLSNDATLTKWDNILNDDLNTKDVKAVEPLMSNTWHQSDPYNMYCPMDGDSRSVVGCGAMAISQIMHYHKYPLHGDGEHSYHCTSNNVDDTLFVDYSSSTYNWDIMPDSLSAGSSSSEKHEVAQICYHVGVALEMEYGNWGSVSYLADMANVFSTYFKYNSTLALYWKSSYTDTRWHNLLIENLDIALPIFYFGTGPDSGHFFVCDGYQTTNYFHFNWGWGGMSDGYFYLDNLNPYYETTMYTFNDLQAVVKDIYPEETDLVVDPFIEDIQSSEDEIIIDLNNYFTSTLGNSISYEIYPSSDINGLSHSITGNILTLTRIERGLSKIAVLASSGDDTIIDIFYVRFGDPLLAGLGNTYDFNGFSTINAGNNASLNSMEKLSVSMWVKLNEVGIDQGIISKSSSTSSGWYVQVQSNNIVKFFVKTQNGWLRKIYSITTLNADQWYHIAVVFDGKDFVMYIDGEYDNQKIYSTASPIEHDEANELILGYAPGMYLDGNIDEVCIWDQPKSIEYFRSVLESQPLASDTDLVSYWSLDEGFYSDIMDLNGINNAVIEGVNLEYWSNSSAPVRYFIARNTNATGVLPGDKDPLYTYSIVNNGTLGTMSILDAEAGTFEYVPDADIFGVDSLSYKVDDGTYSSENISIIFDIKDQNDIDDITIPTSAVLHQNYPNPFNPETTISFSIMEKGPVKLVVFDRMGRNIKTLSDGFRDQGVHNIVWDGKNSFGESVASGVYYYMLKTNNFTDVKKALLLK